MKIRKIIILGLIIVILVGLLLKIAIYKNDKGPIYAKYNDCNLTLLTKYTDNSKIEIVMGKHGGNGLFDFCEVAEIYGDGNREIITHNWSDCFSPYIISVC